MVIPPPIRHPSTGSLVVEMVFALGLLAAVLLPISFSFQGEARLARGLYQRALAIEIVDGEMEVLTAGEWKALTPGSHPYLPRATSVTNLPAGQFTVSFGEGRVRLEWKPAGRNQGGPVVREVRVRP